MFNPKIEIAGLTDIVTKVMQGGYLHDMLVNHKVIVRDNVWVDFTGDFNFKLTFENGFFTVNILDVHPVINVREGLRLSGQLLKIVFKPDMIVLTLNGWPDIHLVNKGD